MSSLFFVGMGLSLICGLIMLIRIFKSSVLLGVLSLFFFPATIIALIRNWNDPDTDIKWPFFLNFVFVGMMFYGAFTTVASVYEQEMMMLSDEDIAEIADGDPETEALLRSQRDTLRAEYDWGSDGAGSPLDDLLPRASIESDTQGFGPLSDAAHEDLNYEAAASGLRYQRGTARFESARLELPLPQHFRFVAIDLLSPQGRVRERVLGPGQFGWIVHERMDMAREEAWWVETRFHADGYVPRPEGALAEQLRGSGAIVLDSGESLLDPAWHAGYGVATWLRTRPDGRFDAHAALPLRHGVMLYTVPDISADERELGVRACRLMAARSVIDRGWSNREFKAGSDREAGVSLAQWISAQSVADVEAAVEAEDALAQ